MNDDRRARRELISVDARIRVDAGRGEEVDLLGERGRGLEIAAVLVDVIASLVAAVDRAVGLRASREILATEDEFGAAPVRSLLHLSAENARLVDYRDACTEII